MPDAVTISRLMPWPPCDLDRPVTDAVTELQKLVADPATAWLLLALWVVGRSRKAGNAHFAMVLEPHARTVDPITRVQANELLTRRLEAFATTDWGDPRQQRLKRSLGAA